MFHDHFHARLQRQRRFFSSCEPGVLLYQDRDVAGLEGFMYEILKDVGVHSLCKESAIRPHLSAYLTQVRDSLRYVYATDGDHLPTVPVYFGIGSVTAAMGGGEARFMSGSSWAEPCLHNWEQLEQLRFDPDNVWVRFAVLVYRELVRSWDGDFLILPYIHRSPLDAANGLRGDQLFEEMYEWPEEVVRLINWCTDWSIALERHIASEVAVPEELHRGVWNTWLPPGAVFVNGDPVGMISREFQRVFDRPFTSRLFSTLGGGFFHHHALGLYQVDQVALTSGLLVQEIYPDPNVPQPVKTLIADPVMREKVIEASFHAPVMLDGSLLEWVAELLPILQRGRFILRLWAGEHIAQSNPLARAIQELDAGAAARCVETQ